jgi:hypothetical protein
MLLDVDAVADRDEQHDHDNERGLDLRLDRETLLDRLHVLGRVVRGDERRHDDDPPEDDRYQRAHRADRLIVFEPTEFVVHLVVPIEEVDPERDE